MNNPIRIGYLTYGLDRAPTGIGRYAIELVRASGPQSLRYLAPEQTGHLPQPIDQRADLYALGAVLYEIFTGRAPFESTEPIELVHAHLARLPEPPRDLVPGIPPPLSSLIQRLLEKSPDARYQSARGVAQDLQRLRKAWHAGHPLTMLRLGTGDIDRRVRSPKRLVGRDAVLALLMAAYHRVADGATEFVLVTGAAGSGKSALARECQHAVLKRLGYFLTDSTNTRDASDSSYPLAGAMAQLAFKLLTESEASLLQWRETFELALGHDCDVLVQIVPAFEAVLGRRIASRAPSASRRRRTAG